MLGGGARRWVGVPGSPRLCRVVLGEGQGRVQVLGRGAPWSWVAMLWVGNLWSAVRSVSLAPIPSCTTSSWNPLHAPAPPPLQTPLHGQHDRAVEPSVAPQLVSLLPNMARLLQRGRDNTAAFQILEAYLLLQVRCGVTWLGLNTAEPVCMSQPLFLSRECALVSRLVVFCSRAVKCCVPPTYSYVRLTLLHLVPQIFIFLAPVCVCGTPTHRQVLHCSLMVKSCQRC